MQLMMSTAKTKASPPTLCRMENSIDKLLRGTNLNRQRKQPLSWILDEGMKFAG